jgi:hypothetical protein
VLFREITKNASVVVTKLDDQHMALCISQSRQRPQKKPGLATSQTSQPLSGVSNINGQQFSGKIDEQNPRFASY